MVYQVKAECPGEWMGLTAGSLWRDAQLVPGRVESDRNQHINTLGRPPLANMSGCMIASQSRI